MPSWNRREKPDYRHLKDATPESALLAAIRSPTYGDGNELDIQASMQARILGIFGEADMLYLAQLVPFHEAARAADPAFPGHGRDWNSVFVHDVVGNAIGQGIRLGILREAPNPGGDRIFLLEIRAPLFERMGSGKWRRVDPQRSARGAGQREAARIRHAEKIGPQVAKLVGELCETGAPVPGEWFTRYPEQFARLKGLVDRIADARPTFEDAHRGMHLADQKWWLKGLSDRLRIVRRELADDRWAGRPPRYGAPVPAALPAEDLDALDGL
ncbi:hypothetical protein [Methylobacterium pseudosasicola]|uniref:Uncharacterized protein n=1 Tax=Methylobacterium pseudosasicola TaxID=582667 RepID=A0A1I4N121_9HYPH|nr:hypothetical protein [Methylobacterium pseudosasicola]SFM09006.1 hypothetical protein SAMN05192568_10196 [Methylobacterium pseudosasicola]